MQVLACVQDVADPDAWAETERRAAQAFDRIDWIIANAGVADGAPIADMSFAAWRRVLSANLDGAFLTLQAGFRPAPRARTS